MLQYARVPVVVALLLASEQREAPTPWAEYSNSRRDIALRFVPVAKSRELDTEGAG